MALARHLQKIGAACYSSGAQVVDPCSLLIKGYEFAWRYCKLYPGPGGVPIAKSSVRALANKQWRPPGNGFRVQRLERGPSMLSQVAPFVECSSKSRQQLPVCRDADIESYPTWTLDCSVAACCSEA